MPVIMTFGNIGKHTLCNKRLLSLRLFEDTCRSLSTALEWNFNKPRGPINNVESHDIELNDTPQSVASKVVAHDICMATPVHPFVDEDVVMTDMDCGGFVISRNGLVRPERYAHLCIVLPQERRIVPDWSNATVRKVYPDLPSESRERRHQFLVRVDQHAFECERSRCHLPPRIHS